MLTYKQKHEQANREALATVVALAVTIVVWAVCGFGLAGLDVQVLHTPLWVIGGTIGTWICSIVVVVVLAKRFFVDFDLDEEPSAGNQAAQVQTRQEARSERRPAAQAHTLPTQAGGSHE